jgi:hypothetical protein
LIHTVGSLLPTFRALCNELMPDVDVFNIVDESLLQDTIRADRLTALTRRRLAGYVVSAAAAGADGILVTCSSVGPAVELAGQLVDVPVLRVDQPMADEAVRLATSQGASRTGRVGVAATLPTTLQPTSELVQARAAAAGVTVQIVPQLCEGAFAAVTSGDGARHDAIVTEGLRALLGQVDVVVLAQASMARVAESLPAAERRVPVLASPRSGVDSLRRALEE